MMQQPAIHPQLHVILDELRHRLEMLYGDRLVTLVLFGSQARRDAEPDSDIDILVVLRGAVDPYAEVDRTGDIITNLCLKYNVVISRLFMDEERFLYNNDALLSNIRRDGIPL